MVLDRMPIGAKLLVLPAIAAIGLVATIWTAHQSGGEMSRSANEILQQGQRTTAELLSLASTLDRAVSLVRAAPGEYDLSDLNTTRSEYTRKRGEFEAHVTSLATFLPQAATVDEDQSSDLGEFLAAGLEVYDYAEGFALLQASEIVAGRFETALQTLLAHATTARNAAESRSQRYLAEFNAANEAMKDRVRIAGLFSIVACLGLSLAIARNLSRRMRRLQVRMTGIAAGDLDEPVFGLSARDELGEMARALQIFRDGLLEKAELLAREAEREAAERQAAVLADRQAREAQEKKAQHREEAEREQAEREAEQLREREAMRAEAERERKAIYDRQAASLMIIAEGLKKIASGRLDAEITEVFESEYEPIRADFNAAVAKLNEIVVLISQGGEEIGRAADQVASAAGNLAQRTESNAVALEETSTTLNELTKAVNTASEEANAANAVASEAQNQSDQGVSVVAETIAAMTAIEAASSKISTIVEVIEGIAFQTNLLALNAGVEAARAGDSGRGFAVVATEVRALAHRSSEAAKETAELIREESTNVQRGVGLVEKTGESLSNISQSVGNMAQRITSISQAAVSQSASISEINTTVAEIDRATQQNAAMFEETNSATHLLKSHADELSYAISWFSTGGSEATIAAE